MIEEFNNINREKREEYEKLEVHCKTEHTIIIVGEYVICKSAI